MTQHDSETTRIILHNRAEVAILQPYENHIKHKGNKEDKEKETEVNCKGNEISKYSSSSNFYLNIRREREKLLLNRMNHIKKNDNAASLVGYNQKQKYKQYKYLRKNSPYLLQYDKIII